jgi:ankyrin repeat protein
MSGERAATTLKHVRIAMRVLLLVALLVVVKATVAAYSTQALLRELKSEPDVYKVQRWLQLGANANARDEDGGTVLDRAAMSVDSDILQLVIDYGAAVNHKIPPHGYTALMTASAVGNLTNVRILLRHGADVTVRSGSASGSRTALSMVRNARKHKLLRNHSQYAEIERLLIKAGAKP